MNQISSRQVRNAGATIGALAVLALLAACGPQVTSTTTEQTTTRQFSPAPVTSSTTTTTIQRTTP